MQLPLLENPLNNQLFIPVLNRFFLLLGIGLILIIILNRFKIKGIWQQELGKRYLSWIVIGVFFFGSIFLGSYTALLFLTTTMILAINEVATLARLPLVYKSVLIFLSIVTLLIAHLNTSLFYILPLFYLIVLTLIAIKRNDEKGLFNLTLSAYVCIWIIFSLSHMLLLGKLNYQLDGTKSLIILLGFMVALADICAYVIGRGFSKTFLGKYKIADKISPNKTYIGVLGNIIGAALGIVIMYFTIGNYLSLNRIILLIFITGILTSLGGFVQSLFKRYYKKKNSGNLIPGHGGILDRIDSTILTIIALYYYLLLIL
mgnify:CR=1 FL=1